LKKKRREQFAKVGVWGDRTLWTLMKLLGGVGLHAHGGFGKLKEPRGRAETPYALPSKKLKNGGEGEKGKKRDNAG